jgi:hypothetical protein
MRRLLVLIAMALALIAGWVLGVFRSSQESTVVAPSHHSGPTIEQIQALAQLVTERINVSDVIESRLAGRTGSISAIVVVKGSVLISTDLSKARFESVDESTRRVVLALPQPAVLEATVDHEQTRVFAVSESGLWRITPSDNAISAAMIDQAYGDAQRFLASAAKDSSIRVRARQHAEQVLGEFLAAGMWKLTVRWAD